MGHARGVICLAAAKAGAPIYHYGATKVKKMLTGSGRRIQATSSASDRPGIWPVRDAGAPDVADAMAIALCHLHYREQNGDFVITRINGNY